MIPNGYNIDMDGYDTSYAFQIDLIHYICTSNVQVMTLVIRRKKIRDLEIDQLDLFIHSVFIIISKVFFISIYRFYTSRAFQRYQEHSNRSSYDKVIVLRSW